MPAFVQPTQLWGCADLSSPRLKRAIERQRESNLYAISQWTRGDSNSRPTCFSVNRYERARFNVGADVGATAFDALMF